MLCVFWYRTVYIRDFFSEQNLTAAEIAHPQQLT
jgi:hypothetical protein